jgi:hypothetical protein
MGLVVMRVVVVVVRVVVVVVGQIAPINASS